MADCPAGVSPVAPGAPACPAFCGSMTPAKAEFCPGCPLLVTCCGLLADAAEGTSEFMGVGLAAVAVSEAAVWFGCQRRSMSLFHCL